MTKDDEDNVKLRAKLGKTPVSKQRTWLYRDYLIVEKFVWIGPLNPSVATYQVKNQRGEILGCFGSVKLAQNFVERHAKSKHEDNSNM